jgi:hypothetical protein
MKSVSLTPTSTASFFQLDAERKKAIQKGDYVRAKELLKQINRL